MAAPIPRVPPVTNATRPAMRASLKLPGSHLKAYPQDFPFQGMISPTFLSAWETQNVGRRAFEVILPAFTPPPPRRGWLCGLPGQLTPLPSPADAQDRPLVTTG